MVNLSKYKVTDAQNKALSHGLNFAVSPDNVHESGIINECIIACEKACWKLPAGEASQLRAEVVGTIKSSKIPKQNVSKEERDAIKLLQKEKSVKILGADKGRATVVMDTEEYEEKLANMLNDTNTYMKLDKDPTPKYKKKLVEIISRLEREEKIRPEDKKYLYPTAEIVPRIYGSPKIHKKDNPLRPIIDYTGSIGYNVSRSLADIISPIVGNTCHHVLNSKQLADDLKDIKLEEDEYLISHDVVSLFTNTPVELTLKIIREKLEQDPNLGKRTRLTVGDIMELVEFILTTTYFSSKGNIYQQKKGVAMGSPLSPIAVDLFMEWLEQEAIATAPQHCKPRLWKRYVDDVLEIIKRGEAENLTKHLDQIDPTGSIKFTFEEEKDGSIPFLDTEISRKPDGSLKLSIYRKATHTNQYLQFQSHHPLHQKLGVVRTLLDRKDNIVTEDPDKEKEEHVIREALSNCGYPKWAIDKVKDKRQTPKIKQKSTKNEEKSKGLVVIPYIEGLTERLSRVYKKHGFSTAMKPYITLRRMLVHPKDKRDPLQTADSMYEIPCKSCSKTYIGETGRIFKTRLSEHQKEAEKQSAKNFTRSQRKTSSSETFKSAITEHVAANNHIINWDAARIIDQESDKTTRWLKEAIWIRSRGKDTMNKDEGAYKLDRIYDQIIHKRQPSELMTSSQSSKVASH